MFATLNHFVGGINPAAAEVGLRLGAREVWMPTIDSQHHVEVHAAGETQEVALQCTYRTHSMDHVPMEPEAGALDLNVRKTVCGQIQDLQVDGMYFMIPLAIRPTRQYARKNVVGVNYRPGSGWPLFSGLGLS